jgi:hypothetical protein
VKETNRSHLCGSVVTPYPLCNPLLYQYTSIIHYFTSPVYKSGVQVRCTSLSPVSGVQSRCPIPVSNLGVPVSNLGVQFVQSRDPLFSFHLVKEKRETGRKDCVGVVGECV